MLRAFKYYISQSVVSMLRNKLMVFISISTVIFCMLLLGLAIIFGMNLTYISDQLESQFEIHAFVDISYKESDAKKLEEKIKKIDGVAAAKFSDKKEALKSLKNMLGNDNDALAGLDDDNPLQFSYKITLSDIKKATSVEKALGKIKGIESVSNRTDILHGISSFASVAGHVSLIGMIIFAVISIFIISNTIKLGLMSRKTEIGIMKSVGATDGFIRSPFIIEGAIVGIVGSLISYVPIIIGYKSAVNWWSGLFGIFRLLPAEEISYIILGVFLVAGVVIGSIGSIASVRKYLDV